MMKLVLAPMEGVVDYKMRQLLSALGGFDWCVTEFIRVVDQLFPPRVFHRYCPELAQGGITDSGTPVRIQLLGQDPNWLAENAVRATELGSFGVDLNFGCPAKTVNKSKGGAVLLKEPERIYQIIKQVRDSVSPEHSVSAKIRLGFDDITEASEIFSAVTSAGADSIAIHARSKRDGYRPPAYWPHIAPLKATTQKQVIANGEIWSVADAKLCRSQSQCADIMLGRGALATPDLARQIKASDTGEAYTPLSWGQVVYHILNSSMHDDDGMSEKYFASRTKQWLGYLKIGYPEAHTLFEEIKRLKEKEQVMSVLEKHCIQ